MTATKISIIETSNPAILKFEADRFITDNSFEFSNIDEAKNSPLAQQLFHLPFVKAVYIASNFIAIERFNIVEWHDVKNAVAELIADYFSKNELAVKDVVKQTHTAVTVYAESTPNPAVLKFVCNKLLVAKSFEFSSLEDAKIAPLAAALFQFPFVKMVFLDKNFISLTKLHTVEWQDITLQLREFIKTYLENGNPILNHKASIENNTSKIDKRKKEDNLDATSKQIIKLLDERIKPAVASDGGNIDFVSYNAQTKTVEVLLQGACSGCPSSTITLKNGIETLLRNALQDNGIIVEASSFD